MPSAHSIARFAKLFVPALIALLSLSAASAGDVISGKYCGTLLAAGQPTEVRTRFEMQAGGLLTGWYAFADKGDMTTGTLRENTKRSDDTHVLTWTDKYGTGQLVVTFDDKGLSFTGKWGTGSDAPTYLWNGKRCEASPV